MAYVVKAMIERTEVYNGSCVLQVAPYLQNPCGSDYTRIIQDLKTVRGVKNRMDKYGWTWPKNTKEIHICSSVNVTNNDCDKLVEKLVEGQFKKA